MGESIRVAAVQPKSLTGSITENLAYLERFIDEAKENHADIVLLPELISAGFEMNDKIWESAEPANGLTAQWLSQQAAKHNMWIGTSFLEASENHFYNTFILVKADGEEAARVRKGTPAATESFFFEGCPSKRIIDSPFGKIGISICYESFFSSTIKDLYEGGADIVLMPMSAPTPTLNSPLTDKDLEEYNVAVKELTSSVARDLGVPVAMANKTGEWKTRPPFPFPLEDSTFPGFSTIADATGQVIACADEAEGMIIADVELNPDKKAKVLPTMGRKWAHTPPDLFKLFIISESLGKLRYMFSMKRRRMANLKSKPV